MSTLELSELQSQTNQTMLGGSGIPAVPIQIGPDIPDDKVRRIWKLTIIDASGGNRVLFLYAGDTADPDRRLIYRKDVPAWASLIVPGKSNPLRVLLTIRPQTQFSPTQENQIYCTSDIAVANAIFLDYHYYDKRG